MGSSISPGKGAGQLSLGTPPAQGSGDSQLRCPAVKSQEST